MNLILLSQILKRHDWFSFSTMRRIHNRSGTTNSEVKFIICCFSFIAHGGEEDLFWRWVRRSNLSDEHKRSLLSFNRPSNNNVHSNEFLGLCQNFQFLLSFRAILETYPFSNLGRFVDSTLVWGHQPEGASFWSTFNSIIGAAWTAYRRFNKSDDGSTINPNVSVTSLRDSVFIPMSLRSRGDTSLLSEFCLSYVVGQEATGTSSTRIAVADPFESGEIIAERDRGNTISNDILDAADRIASSAGLYYEIRAEPSPISWSFATSSSSAGITNSE